MKTLTRCIAVLVFCASAPLTFAAQPAQVLTQDLPALRVAGKVSAVMWTRRDDAFTLQVVLEMPTHLRDLVEAGVALGVPKGRDPGGALWSALRDPDAREQLAEARGRYLSELALGVDGRATERILALVREMAGATACTEAART